ncbi:ABC transporter permease [Phreatobacter aquaticus]|uniref:ABC transporter permease n=1 Tax=Phreatobacter aquaticus TaxID=2570229 RepID=A0A4D7QLQ0_9HYPH|nr:ABC transporter permease [Phreatobacter aquaticus]QCK86306.1 ABC transporter permease [Phreatobacter aquaticus]
MNGDRLRGLVLPAAAVLALEAWLRISPIKSDALAPPSEVVIALAAALGDGSILLATGDTLIGALAGLMLGAAIGLAIGILIGLLPPIDHLLEVPIESIRPIPSVALLPIALMVFGFGYLLEISIVAKTCMFATLIMTRAAVRGVEPRLMEVARALRLSPIARVTKIVLPAALPGIFVGFRLAASAALIVAVTAEITMNPQGLGHAMMTAQQALRPDLMLAYLVWIGLVGFLWNAVLLFAQRHLFGRAALAEGDR